MSHHHYESLSIYCGSCHRAIFVLQMFQHIQTARNSNMHNNQTKEALAATSAKLEASKDFTAALQQELAELGAKAAESDNYGLRLAAELEATKAELAESCSSIAAARVVATASLDHHNSLELASAQASLDAKQAEVESLQAALKRAKTELEATKLSLASAEKVCHDLEAYISL